MNSDKSNRDYSALISGELCVDKPKKWHSKALLQLAAYIIVCLLLILLLPNKLWQPELKTVTITLGTLGIWRYSWWFVHVLRSEFYQRAAASRRSAPMRIKSGAMAGDRGICIL